MSLFLPVAALALIAYGLFFDRTAQRRDKIAVLIMAPGVVIFLLHALTRH